MVFERKKTMKLKTTKIILQIIIFIILFQAITLPSYATDYSNTAIIDDLIEDNYDISNFEINKSNTFIKIIHLKETNYESNGDNSEFKLFIYIYNPSGRAIDSVYNTIDLSLGMGSNLTKINTYSLKLISSINDKSIYKFEITGIEKEIINNLFSARRKYTISGIQIKYRKENAQKYAMETPITVYYTGYSSEKDSTGQNTLSFDINFNNQEIKINTIKETIDNEKKPTESTTLITGIYAPDIPQKLDKQENRLKIFSNVMIITGILILIFCITMIILTKEKIITTKNNSAQKKESLNNNTQKESYNLSYTKQKQETIQPQSINRQPNNDTIEEITKNQNEIFDLKERITKLEAQLKFANTTPQQKSTDSNVEELKKEILSLQKQIDSYTANNDFRRKYPTPYLCDDGHWVRSKIEREIDNFFFEHNIRHVFEKEYRSNRKKYYPDFFLPDYKLIIEYFGKDDEEYTAKKEEKIRMYSADHSIKFEQITYQDDNRMREKLTDICLKHHIPL